MMNVALLAALDSKRPQIEAAYGDSLDWRGLSAAGLQTKRTKVVAPKVSIGDRTAPTVEGLEALTSSARRLIDAVRPHLADAFDSATAAASEETADEVEELLL